MGSINIIKNGTLYLDFRYRGKRCKEYTRLKDSPANRRRLAKILERIEAEITLGTFSYGSYFPESKRVAEFGKELERVELIQSGMPSFDSFSSTWHDQKRVEWRETHADTVRYILDKYIIPVFGERSLTSITKADILDFRAEISKRKGRKEATISADHINHIIAPLRMVMNEAADQFGFVSPCQGIKTLKVPKTDVQPFSLVEVNQILKFVRPDFTNYICTRFFTGARSSEINGLQWKYINFDRREILIRHAWVEGKLRQPKNEASNRAILMSEPVFKALKAQEKVTGDGQFVFCTGTGGPVNANNFSRRVWYPLLKILRIEKRRPYQTRHTAASLWLASGESPEWIATQMGHTSTELLFRTYSAYVKNLTRQDGSAFEAVLAQSLEIPTESKGEQK